MVSCLYKDCLFLTDNQPEIHSTQIMERAKCVAEIPPFHLTPLIIIIQLLGGWAVLLYNTHLYYTHHTLVTSTVIDREAGRAS